MDLQEFLASGHDAPPRYLGQRHSATQFMPDPGNTVVCHLDRDAPGGRAVLRARKRIMALPGAERLLFTHEDSLHMTVFEGVLDARRTADAWPADMARDASVEAVTDAMVARFQTFTGAAPFEVRVEALHVGGLKLRGATPADAQALLDWREALSAAFGYRQAAHDSYQHHLTFAYPVAWLPDDLAPVWAEALAEITAELIASAPVLPLRPPAFCAFNDMNHFEELVVLNGHS